MHRPSAQALYTVHPSYSLKEEKSKRLEDEYQSLRRGLLAAREQAQSDSILANPVLPAEVRPLPVSSSACRQLACSALPLLRPSH